MSPLQASVTAMSRAMVPFSNAELGLVGAISLILIAVGAPALGALYARTENFSLAFGLLGAFALLVFWLTGLIREEKAAVR